MCWQDGCGAERPKTTEQQPTWPPHLSLIKTIPLKRQDGLLLLAGKNKWNRINLRRLWLWKCFSLFPIKWTIVAAAKKEMCYSSSSPPPLRYVPPRFFRLDLPQRLQGCFVLLHVTICCWWDRHVILLMTVVRSVVLAAQDVQQLLPVRMQADVFCRINTFVRDWSTGQLYSPGGCKLQASKWRKVLLWVSQWKRACIWTAAIVVSQPNIDCYYGITGDL